MDLTLTEEEMRQALFNDTEPTKHVIVIPIEVPAPDSSAAKSVNLPPQNKAFKSTKCRMQVILNVGNDFEGKTYEIIHEADTLSTLLAAQEAVRVARKKYRYVELISVKPR